MNDLIKAEKIAKEIADCGGRAYFVGGFVRDSLLKIENKDIDIEVHGIEKEKLRQILSCHGELIEIGESFGIFSLKGCNMDFAMPRSEKAVGKGHRDFEIGTDPFIGTKNAAKRRDFTVNALMRDVLTGEILDYFGGVRDLNEKVLRYVNDESFPEDPLRVLRLARFAARFGFSVANETKKLCKSVDLSFLAKERVVEELKKALLKSDKPSLFFEVLREVDGLDVWFPEVKKLISLPQNPVFHPEGDVWIHTMQVLDAGVHFREECKNPFGFMLSCLCHDFGKALTTKRGEDGKIHAYNHEKAGLSEVERFLKRLTDEKYILSYVKNMTLLHMKPTVMINAGSAQKKFNRLFDESVCPKELIFLSSCDNFSKHEKTQAALFEKYEIFKEYMSRPYVMGRDLTAAGLVPDESFSTLLQYAHKLRLAGVDKQTALKQVVNEAKSDKQ